MINDFGDKYKCLNVLKDFSKIKNLTDLTTKRQLINAEDFLRLSYVFVNFVIFFKYYMSLDFTRNI